MRDKTLYEEIYEVTRSIDRIIKNVDTTLEYLEDMKKEGINDWRLEPSILELKEAKNRLGRDVF